MSDHMKTGLVLEGGAMRGLFTAGVLDVLMENDIYLDGTIGVSAGAVFGCNYKSRQIGRTLRYNKRFCREPKYCSIRSLLKTGDLYGAEFCYRTLPDELDIFDRKTYAETPEPFYAVCTDCDTGKTVYPALPAGDDKDLDWMRASASMPVASRPVEIDGGRYLDGGISDSIPLKEFERMGYERNVVILTQPDSYRKEAPKTQFIVNLFLRKLPAVKRLLADRHERYNAQVEYVRAREKCGAAFVIRPSGPLCIGSVCHDPNELQRVYDIGRSVMLERLPELKEFLEEK